MNAHEIAKAANTLRNTAEYVEIYAQGAEPFSRWSMARDAWTAYKQAAHLYREAARTPSNTTSSAEISHWQKMAEDAFQVQAAVPPPPEGHAGPRIEQAGFPVRRIAGDGSADHQSGHAALVLHCG